MDREDKNRESDRRRKDREGPDPEVRGSSSSEKVAAQSCVFLLPLLISC